MTTCGLIAIIGAPNAGKSTLVNRLVGSKIAIVTPKAQTTRYALRGVAIDGEAQLVLIDTPGIFNAEAAYERNMVEAAWCGMADADSVLMLVDAGHGLTMLTKSVIEQLSTRLRHRHSHEGANGNAKPIYLALNKIDQMEKSKLLALIAECADFALFTEIFLISAITGDGIKEMTATLAKSLPEGHWLYPQEQLSDSSERQLAAEITREKLFLMLDQELPYSLTVETESWEDKQQKNGEKLAVISQAIIVEREGQKKIVLGEKGTRIKAIGTSARQEMERLLDCKIHLTLFVKVRSNWKKNTSNEQAF